MATKTPKTYASDDNLTVTDGSVESLADALASTSNGYGASLIGIEDVGTKFVATDVEAALAEAMTDLDQAELDIGDLETKQAAGQIYIVASKQILFSDLTAAALTESIDFDAALPADAIALGAWIKVTTKFDDGTGGVSLSAMATDIGISGGDADYFVDGTDTYTAAGNFMSNPGVAFDGSRSATYVGGETPAVLFTATGANLDTLTTGDLTAYVYYIVPAA